jgi:mannose-6-phosphate isomerase-like protein (cupin superfamily)
MECCCDGVGVTEFEHFLLGNDLPPHVNLSTIVRLAKGTGIGLHHHYDETEFYLILEGEGIVQDDDVITPILKGDFLLTEHGHRHSIANNQDTPLVFLATIVSK